MKFDGTKIVRNLNGSEARQPLQEGGFGPPISYGDIVISALVAPERGLDGKEQIRRAKLAHALHGAKAPIEITVEDAALVKKLVEAQGMPLVTLQIHDHIEGATDSSPKNGNGETLRLDDMHH